MADHIYIKNLECFANHGVLEAEKQLGQKFLVSLDMEVDTRKAGNTDNLKYSVNYAEVSQTVMTFMKEQTFDLIETVAEKIANQLLLKYSLLLAIQVEIKKPWAPVMLPLETVAVSVRRGWHTVYFGVGSNMGDSTKNIEDAIAHFSNHPQCQLVAQSQLIFTKPYGVKEQDDFVNGVFYIRTLLTPEELLQEIGEVEKKLNRVRNLHWGPRTIDVDILFYDDEIWHSKDLTIPHPEIAKRDFVLAPLCEIDPYLVHPVYHKTMKDMYEELLAKSNYEVTVKENGGF